MGILRAKQPTKNDLLRGMVAEIVGILFMVSTVQIKSNKIMLPSLTAIE